jgi:hypothetical protein
MRFGRRRICTAAQIVRDRTSRLIAALLAGVIAISVNTAMLVGADAYGIKTAHGGLLRLLADVADGLAGRIVLTARWNTIFSPAVSSARFQLVFHVLIGLLMAIFYAYLVEPALIFRPWVKGLIYAATVWMLNAIIVLPLIGEGFAGSRHLSAAGMIGFAVAHTIFFVILAVLYEPLRKRLALPLCDCGRESAH